MIRDQLTAEFQQVAPVQRLQVKCENWYRRERNSNSHGKVSNREAKGCWWSVTSEAAGNWLFRCTCPQKPSQGFAQREV